MHLFLYVFREFCRSLVSSVFRHFVLYVFMYVVRYACRSVDVLLAV